VTINDFLALPLPKLPKTKLLLLDLIQVFPHGASKMSKVTVKALDAKHWMPSIRCQDAKHWSKQSMVTSEYK